MLELVVDPTQLAAIAEELTPLPAAVLRLNELVFSEAPSVREIEDVVAFDPALAAAVLQGANSAMYARQRSASTVRDAILRIGTTGLAGVAMRMATADEMRADLPMYGMASGALLDHAVRSATAAEALRRHVPAKVPAPATVAALLHDTGKLVLSRFVGNRFAALVADLATEDDHELWLLEREVFGADHATVAVHLGRHWRLPPAIVDGMVNHHEPANGTAVAHTVHVANAIAAATVGRTCGSAASVRESLDQLTIEPTAFAQLCAQTVEMLDLNPLAAG